MEKVDIGYLRVVATKRGVLKDCVITDLSFTSLDVPAGLYNIDNEQCYLVKKADLDAYMASEESLEKTKGTPDWYLSNRIKQLEAENANLRDINKSLGEEHSKLVEENEALKDAIGKYYYGVCSAKCALRATNEKLAAEVDDLNKRISHLKVILEHDENRMAALITENNKLRGTYNELNSTVTWLRQELAKYTEEHTVEFLYEKHEDGKHFIGWTEVSGEEYELTFLTPERKIHE